MTEKNKNNEFDKYNNLLDNSSSAWAWEFLKRNVKFRDFVSKKKPTGKVDLE